MQREKGEEILLNLIMYIYLALGNSVKNCLKVLKVLESSPLVFRDKGREVSCV